MSLLEIQMFDGIWYKWVPTVIRIGNWEGAGFTWEPAPELVLFLTDSNFLPDTFKQKEVFEFAGLDLTGSADQTFTLRPEDIDPPRILPMLEPAHTAPLGHTHHWWQRCRPGCPRFQH